MPKRKPSRSRRRRSPGSYTQRVAPTPPPPVAPLDPLAPVSIGVAPAIPAEPVREHARQRQVTRFSARDYTYVKREIRRILILATAVIIAIVVLSFFLP